MADDWNLYHSPNGCGIPRLGQNEIVDNVAWDEETEELPGIEGDTTTAHTGLGLGPNPARQHQEQQQQQEQDQLLNQRFLPPPELPPNLRALVGQSFVEFGAEELVTLVGQMEEFAQMLRQIWSSACIEPWRLGYFLQSCLVIEELLRKANLVIWRVHNLAPVTALVVLDPSPMTPIVLKTGAKQSNPMRPIFIKLITIDGIGIKNVKLNSASSVLSPYYGSEHTAHKAKVLPIVHHDETSVGYDLNTDTWAIPQVYFKSTSENTVFQVEFELAVLTSDDQETIVTVRSKPLCVFSVITQWPTVEAHYVWDMAVTFSSSIYESVSRCALFNALQVSQLIRTMQLDLTKIPWYVEPNGECIQRVLYPDEVRAMFPPVNSVAVVSFNTFESQWDWWGHMLYAFRQSKIKQELCDSWFHGLLHFAPRSWVALWLEDMLKSSEAGTAIFRTSSSPGQLAFDVVVANGIVKSYRKPRAPLRDLFNDLAISRIITLEGTVVEIKELNSRYGFKLKPIIPYETPKNPEREQRATSSMATD